jgi:hypothetical protein
MVVCSVQAGKATQTLIESLLPFYSAGAGRIPNPSEPNRINKIAADLGDIVAGRAVFTDGGTARFDWGTPNAATGVVLGLEDRDNNAYGAVYIYEGGEVRAKLGRMTGLPDIGSVTPTGWGLYTTNGYFQGVGVASTIARRHNRGRAAGRPGDRRRADHRRHGGGRPGRGRHGDGRSAHRRLRW